MSLAFVGPDHPEKCAWCNKDFPERELVVTYPLIDRERLYWHIECAWEMGQSINQEAAQMLDAKPAKS